MTNECGASLSSGRGMKELLWEGNVDPSKENKEPRWNWEVKKDEGLGGKTVQPKSTTAFAPPCKQRKKSEQAKSHEIIPC